MEQKKNRKQNRNNEKNKYASQNSNTYTVAHTRLISWRANAHQVYDEDRLNGLLYIHWPSSLRARKWKEIEIVKFYMYVSAILLPHFIYSLSVWFCFVLSLNVNRFKLIQKLQIDRGCYTILLSNRYDRIESDGDGGIENFSSFGFNLYTMYILYILHSTQYTHIHTLKVSEEKNFFLFVVRIEVLFWFWFWFWNMLCLCIECQNSSNIDAHIFIHTNPSARTTTSITYMPKILFIIDRTHFTSSHQCIG